MVIDVNETCSGHFAIYTNIQLLFCSLQIDSKKDYKLLYCETCFIVVVWSLTCNISEICGDIHKI